MAFYYHMIYSLETDRQVRHCSGLQSLRLQQINTYNDTYSVHDEALMSLRARLFCLLASCESLSVSTVGYNCLSSLPPGKPGPPSPPGIHGDPISLRFHAHPRPFVCYNNFEIQDDGLSDRVTVQYRKGACRILDRRPAYGT
jgi:hypothetical protein